MPFIVAATRIGVLTGLLSLTAAALVCAGWLSVVLFPVASLALLRAHLSISTDAGAAASS